MPDDGYLTFEDGIVSLDGENLPGVLASVSVAGRVRYDQAKQDGLSGSTKTPMGWKDSAVTLTLDLLSDESGDCYDKLTALDRIFKGLDADKNPRVYSVTGRHFRARKIDQVVFDSLTSDEDDQSDTIRAVLNFDEHLPPVVQQEMQAAAGSAAGQTPVVAPAQPTAEPAALKDDVNPLVAGLSSGLG